MLGNVYGRDDSPDGVNSNDSRNSLSHDGRPHAFFGQKNGNQAAEDIGLTPKDGEEQEKGTGFWNWLTGRGNKKQVEPSSNPKEDGVTQDATKTRTRGTDFDNIVFSRSGQQLTKEIIEELYMRDEQIMEAFNSLKIEYEEFQKDP